MKIINNRSLIALFFLVSIFVLEWILFRNYILKAVAWSPFLNGDANWYLGHSYIIFDSIVKNGTIPPVFISDPSGIMVFLVSSVLYLIFGASRLVALSTNFVFFIFWQTIVFYTIRYITKSWLFAFMILGLCLTVSAPFQGDDIYPILYIAEYQRDFIIFCLFGIFIAAILASDTFLKRKQSIYVGFIAGFLIAFRYAMFFNMIGIYITIDIVFFVLYLLSRKYWPLIFSSYKNRIINLALSFCAMTLIFIYPIYKAKEALYHHYFVGKLVGPKDTNFIQLYSQGVTTFIQQVMYYPRMITNTYIGKYFFYTFLIAIFLLIIFITFSIIKYNKSLKTKMICSKIILKPKGLNIINYNFPLYVLMLIICVGFPLFLLTLYPVRAGNVAVFLGQPAFMFACIILTYLFNKYHVQKAKILSIILLIMMSTTLSLGIDYQIKRYNRGSVSLNNKIDYLQVARLYDDIIELSKDKQIKSPRISVNFIENYTLGCGEAITSYYYERKGEIFRVAQMLGSDPGNPINTQDALTLISESDIVLLSVKEDPLENRLPKNRDPLSEGFIQHPFYKSMKEMNPILVEFVNANFYPVHKYEIFNREIIMYFNKHPRPISSASEPIPDLKITADKSNINSPPEFVNRSSPNLFWETPGGYPYWIQFEFTAKTKIITKYSLKTGIHEGATEEMPKDWRFQGSEDEANWVTLDARQDQTKWKKDEERIYNVVNNKDYKYYRLYFEQGNRPDYIRIYGISLKE